MGIIKMNDFVKDWSHILGFLLTAGTIISSISYASRKLDTFVTKPELQMVVETQDVKFNRGQRSQDDFWDERIKYAAEAAARIASISADQAAEKRMKRWAKAIGVKNLTTYLDTVGEDGN